MITTNLTRPELIAELRRISQILRPVLQKDEQLKLTPISVDVPAQPQTTWSRLLYAIFPPMSEPDTQTVTVWVAGTLGEGSMHSTLYIDLGGETYISRCFTQRTPVLLQDAEPEDHTDQGLSDLLDAVIGANKSRLLVYGAFVSAGAIPNN